MANDKLSDAIDDVLPQTQCGLCGYGACRPYAQAISIHDETIDRCPPGGIKTLLALAKLTGQNATPYIEEMEQKAKAPSRAVIRESECIGCTKCIQACPVDAILGSAKQMHSVIAQECTGCELCIKPCPVDCIDMVQIEPLLETIQKEKSSLARQRFLARNRRGQTLKHTQQQEIVSRRKATIQEALVRVQRKKEIVK